MVAAATGAMMSAMTATPAGPAGKGADANKGDATQNASGDFNQLIAELLGDTASAADTPKAPAAIATLSVDAGASADQPAAPDATVTPEMLALGYLTGLTPPPPTKAPTTAVAAESGSIDPLATGAGSASADAARMQQLTQLLAKNVDKNVDTPAAATGKEPATGAGQNNDRFALNALFANTDAALAVTQDKSAELVAKLKDSGDDAAPVQAGGPQHNTYDQLQQAGLTQARFQDALATEQRPQYTIHAPMGSQQWSAELGNKLTLMATHNTQSASLQLTPDNLGPVQVKIEINQNQASVWFTADQADTRAALEQSLPKLRELFAAQGMSLTDAGVSGQRSQQQSQASFSNSGRATASESRSVEAVTSSRTLSIGLLDTYA